VGTDEDSSASSVVTSSDSSQSSDDDDEFTVKGFKSHLKKPEKKEKKTKIQKKGYLE